MPHYVQRHLKTCYISNGREKWTKTHETMIIKKPTKTLRNDNSICYCTSLSCWCRSSMIDPYERSKSAWKWEKKNEYATSPGSDQRLTKLWASIFDYSGCYYTMQQRLRRDTPAIKWAIFQLIFSRKEDGAGMGDMVAKLALKVRECLSSAALA
jgi:hypothetical protein